ncbi:hypothetical protein P7225_14175 [Vibrio parahaemolyticus]|nr:hypothetical protein [Vibrio parahaemolyticus]
MSEQKRIEEKIKRTEKISDLTLYIAFGLMALTYSTFNAKSEFASLLLEGYKTEFLLASLCGVLSILSHYLQYFCGYISVEKALKEEDFQYNRKWIIYKVVRYFFYAKQFFSIAGVIVVGYAMIRVLFS